MVTFDMLVEAHRASRDTNEQYGDRSDKHRAAFAEYQHLRATADEAVGSDFAVCLWTGNYPAIRK